MLGADRPLIASGRLDNQVSCWAAVSALASTQTGPTITCALFDHEESARRRAGPRALLADVIERLLAGPGVDPVDDVRRVIASSSCVSADNAHAVHPNYAERHDPGHAPLVNHGPAIKLNPNQRYATDAGTAALFQSCARRPAFRCRRSSHATTSRAGRRSDR